MASVDEPKAGERVNKLWTKVVSCIRALNPLLNMTVEITDSTGKSVVGVTGKFIYSQGNVKLVITLP